MDWRFPIGILLLLNFGVLPILAQSDNNGKSTEPEEWNVINGTIKRNYTLTGIPQIDYVHDPNLPRELNGYNLSTYPFFNKIPKNINFSCDGLKDGFYASVMHGCQLYHHCLFGTRYDFLCANYTAFDQRTFICQFVSEVDCPNSALFFHRNDALYQAVSTTTPAPVVIYVGPNGRRIRPSPIVPFREEPQKLSEDLPVPTTPSSKQIEEDDDYSSLPIRDRSFPRRRNRRRCGPGRRRRCRRPRPRPDYYDYYDYEDYYDSDRRKKPNKGRDREREYDYDEYDVDGDFEKLNPVQKKRTKFQENEFESRLLGGTSSRSSVSKAKTLPMSPSVSTVAPDAPPDPLLAAANREKIFSKSRAPPKIRPPVPRSEKSKYGSIQGRPEVTTIATTTTTKFLRTTSRVPSSTTLVSPTGEYEEYYYDEHEAPTTYRNHVLGEIPTRRTTTTTTTTTTPAPPRPTTEPQYEYEYEEYDDSTTLKPEPTTFRNFQGPRRFQIQPRQESSQVVEERQKAPGIEHQKINEALETPNRASLRIPYHNKPRPAFLRNAQMLQPLTTEKSTTTASAVPPTETSASPFDSSFDGVSRRFPVFDTRLPLETVSAEAEKQRQRYQAKDTPTAVETAEEYMGFEEVDPDEVTERYGQQYTESHSTQFTPVPSRRSSIYPLVPYASEPGPLAQRSRSLTFDSPRTTSLPNANRPEYISLVSEEEEAPSPYTAQMRTRIRQGLMRGHLMEASAQTLYPSYLHAPPGYIVQYGFPPGIRR